MGKILQKKAVKIGQLIPYESNAKIHGPDQIERIKASIQEFGFLSPIIIDRERNVIAGHGCILAAEALGMQEVPCIVVDGLTEEQRRAYILADNRLTELGAWDNGLILDELEFLQDAGFDTDLTGFDIDDFTDWGGLGDYEDDTPASMSHNVFENQEKRQYDTDNWYGIPEMEATHTKGDKLLRFCDFNQIDDHENYIAHFYYDDFKFINAWRDPDKYLEKLARFKAVISPDFSLYTDFPRALQILSCYRRQWCGKYWQEAGLDVIPDVVWGDEESYKFCFLGIPKHSTVAVSSVGVTVDKEWNGKNNSLFLQGYNEMLKRLEPETIIYYGTEIDGLEGNVIRVPSFYEERRGSLPDKRNEG